MMANEDRQAFQLSALLKAEQALERLAALEEINAQADSAAFSSQPPGVGTAVDPLAPMHLINDLVADKKMEIDRGETLSPEKQRALDEETESMQWAIIEDRIMKREELKMIEMGVKTAE